MKSRGAQKCISFEIARFYGGSRALKNAFPTAPALEYKRMLDLDGTSGAKSVAKTEKRERNKKIENYYFLVRDASEKLPGLKYHPPSKFTNEGDGIRTMHIYCHHRFLAGLVAIRRIPCHCEGCQKQIKEEWV